MQTFWIWLAFFVAIVRFGKHNTLIWLHKGLRVFWILKWRSPIFFQGGNQMKVRDTCAACAVVCCSRASFRVAKFF